MEERSVEQRNDLKKIWKKGRLNSGKIWKYGSVPKCAGTTDNRNARSTCPTSVFTGTEQSDKR